MNATSTSTPASVSRITVAPTVSEQACNGLGLQLDFINRSQVGRQTAFASRSLGPTIGVGRLRSTPSSLSRKRTHFADGNDILSIIISSGGRFQVEGVRGPDRGSTHAAIVLESSRTSVVHALDHGSAWTIRLDRAALEPMLVGICDPLQRCLGADNPGIRLLEGYLGALFAFDQDLTLPALHIHDLALYALGVRGDMQLLVRERGVQAARQSAVLAALRNRAAEPRLDPAAVAAELGLSVRYLHRLLEPTGSTFAEHLARQRLERASAMLRDAACAHLKIAEIAARAGFADISHFNRSFRRTFGDTPFGVRVRSSRAQQGEDRSRRGLTISNSVYTPKS
jgi:AraC-like DNA-binding protein